MKLKRFAQSTFLLTSREDNRLLVDPGKYNLDPGRLTPETFPTADIVVITHKHADHFDLQILKALVRKSTPLIITNSEVKRMLETEGIRSVALPENSTISEEGFSVTAVKTDHIYEGESVINFGIVVEGDDTSLYYTSDTHYLEPAFLPVKTRTKYLLLHINDRGVSMGMDDAIMFSRELNPELVIPVHYDSPLDRDRVNPKEFAERAAKFGVRVRVMGFGEEMQL